VVERALDHRLGARLAVALQQVALERAGIDPDPHRAAVVFRRLDSTKAAPSSSWRNRLITLPTGEIHSYLRQIPRVDRLAQRAVLLTKLARGTFVSKKFRTPVRQPLLRLHLTQPGEYGGAAPG
jgi:hypothetical protein